MSEPSDEGDVETVDGTDADTADEPDAESGTADVPGVETVDRWTNWSGSLSFEPEGVVRPESEAELRALVARCADGGRHVRAVGSGHSATGILETDGLLVNLEKMSGVVSHDVDAEEATVRAGITVEEAGSELLELGLAMPNFGDVSTQMVAGSIATGTHGTGPEFRNLSNVLLGGRMVTASGDVVAFHEDEDPEFLRAARVSLGSLGIFTALRLDLTSAYKLQRREYCTTWRDVRDHVEDLVAENRNVDFYWYPRSDEVKLRLLNPVHGGTDELPYATLVEERTGWAHQIIPKHSHIPRKFDEMEYAVPADVGIDCFLEVRDRIRERWRGEVGWRVLWRTVAADDAFLSPAYGRPTVTISLHQNAELGFREFFEDVEPIFRQYGGRPHWAKKHTLRAPELAELYPEWERFRTFRREMDPDGVFTSDYLHDLLEGDGGEPSEARRASSGERSESDGGGREERARTSSGERSESDGDPS